MEERIKENGEGKQRIGETKEAGDRRD